MEVGEKMSPGLLTTRQLKILFTKTTETLRDLVQLFVLSKGSSAESSVTRQCRHSFFNGDGGE
jgi:hypothetical protein